MSEEKTIRVKCELLGQLQDDLISVSEALSRIAEAAQLMPIGLTVEQAEERRRAAEAEVTAAE